MTKVKELLVGLEEPSGCGIVAAILSHQEVTYAQELSHRYGWRDRARQ